MEAMLQNKPFLSRKPENDYTQLIDIIPMEKTKVNNHTGLSVTSNDSGFTQFEEGDTPK